MDTNSESIFQSMRDMLNDMEHTVKTVESTPHKGASAPFCEKVDIRIRLVGRWRIFKLLFKVALGVFTGTVRFSVKRKPC